LMLVRENLRAGDSRPAPWFVVVPETWRRALSEDVLIPLLGDYLPPTADPTLLLAQVVMGGVLGFLCLVWAWNSYRRPEPLVLLRCIFLTLAWAWLLASAQNPWYLVWCLPFMVFAGRASWFLLPGLVLLYYARFWIEARMPGNVDIFDYGLVWLEYMPFFVALAIETWSPLVRRLRLSTDERDHAQPQPLNWGA